MKENYEKYLLAAKEDLRTTYEGLVAVVNERASGDHRHISAKHKMETHVALFQLTASYQMAARGDSLEMVQAVRQAMAGTFFIVWHCGASPAAKKYFDNQDHGRGGITAGKAKQANARIWERWVDSQIAAKNSKMEWTKLASLRIADKLKAYKQLPVTLPDRDRLARYISKSRKASAVPSKKKVIRLVHG